MKIAVFVSFASHRGVSSGPDLGMGKMGSCPGASTYFMKKIKNKKNRKENVMFLVFYGRGGPPLLKAAQGPPHV